ncbi:MAG TPA: hypothetical protein VFG03_04660, partial [Telluria sp.]|nr:hypothetical protein [Telluria sp.]
PLAERAMAEDLLLAPGSLFSPTQLPSTRLRLNVAAMQDPRAWEFLEREIGAAARRSLCSETTSRESGSPC